MKFNAKYRIVSVISVICLVFAMIPMTTIQAAAADYSTDIVINSWSIKDSSDNDYSASNPVLATVTSGKLVFNWSLTVPGGNTLHDGDTITLPAPAGSGPKVFASMADGSWSIFYDGATPMGQWRINANQIEIVFGANAEGYTSITGITFETGASAVNFYYQSTVDITESISFEGMPQSITFKGTPLIPGGASPMYKGGTVGSNSQISWFATNGYDSILNETKTHGLSYSDGGTPLGTDAVPKNNCYFEDTITDGGIFVNGSEHFYACLPLPSILSPTALSSANANYNILVDHLFTRRTDSASFASYALFKASLNQMEWGVYNDGGIERVVVYFGNLGANGVTYANASPTWLPDAVQHSFDVAYPDTPVNRTLLQTWFDTVYGTGNAFGGNIAAFNFHFSTEYDTAIYDTEKTNIGYMEVSGSMYTSMPAIGTLQGLLGRVTVGAYSARAYKVDADNPSVYLTGASIKLQKTPDGGVTWSDYGTPQITAAPNGTVNFSGLSAGTYRFVETSPSPGYSLSASPGYVTGVGVVSDTFEVVAGETVGHLATLRNKIASTFDISGSVWLDSDNDGIMSGTEPLYTAEPVKVELQKNGTTIATVYTTSDGTASGTPTGNYSFTTNEKTDLSIKITLPSGYDITQPPNPGIDNKFPIPTQTVVLPNPLTANVTAQNCAINRGIATKTVDKTTANVDDNLTYTITYRNTASTTENLEIADIIPINTELVSIPLGATAYSDVGMTTVTTIASDTRGLKFVIPAVPAGTGGNVQFTVKLLLSSVGTTVSNQGTVTVGSIYQWQTTRVQTYVPDPDGIVSNGIGQSGKKSFSATLMKVDANDPSTVLPGAKFELYKVTSSGDVKVGTYTTDNAGKIVAGSLKSGDYYWLEIASPSGYLLDDTKHTFTISNTSISQTLTNTRTEVPDEFGDNHYAYIVGRTDGLVHPDNSITRAEVATIFFRLLSDGERNANLTSTNSYTDVNNNAWYNKAISTLSKMGILRGVGNSRFLPDNSISRAEFATIAARFDTTGNNSMASFSDISDHWASSEISISANNGWVKGYKDGTFRPNNNITRAEAITFVNHVLQRMPENENDLLPDMVVWKDNADLKSWYYLEIQEAANSHLYTRKMSGFETWTELEPVRDWVTEFEK